MNRSITLAFAIVLAGAHQAAAQSIFASQGLGVPVPAADARTRALGGVGTGLRGQTVSLVNPAEAADFRIRGLAAALQSSSHAVDFEGAESHFGANRFPMLQILYPVGERVVFTIGYGGFLDQSWAAFTDRSEPVGDDTVAVRDLVESSGGLAQVQAGVAYALTPGLSVGLAGGFYSGGLDRTITRNFTGGDLPGVESFTSELSWSQRAPFASAGLRWDIGSILRLAGSITWAGTLDAHAESDLARDFEVQLPLQASAGASALLAPRLLAAVSGRWAGWSAAADDLGGNAGDTWEVGAGLEWDALRFGDRSTPLRVGYRYGQYPFHVDGALPTERAFSFGTGLRFGRTAAGPRASLDAAVERGSRDVSGAAFAEDFWRFTVSLAVFGQ
ncbi:MAG TPA: hypothetical protein VF158_00175 [Longimicrobiales bacterium]